METFKSHSILLKVVGGTRNPFFDLIYADLMRAEANTRIRIAK